MSKQTPFDDLKDFVAIPRVAGLRLSPDGSWLAAPVQTLSADGKKYLTSIWRIDPQGGPARRLTRSAEGEASPRFLPDGALIFTSRRPDPGADKARAGATPGDVAALWLLPPGGGEARIVATLPGGLAAAEVARDTGTIVVSSPVLPAAVHGSPGQGGLGGRAVPPDGGSPGGSPPGDSTDEQLRKERGDAGVTAILHESAPVRFWDHDLGPDQLRLFALDPERLAEAGEAASGAPEGTGLRDLTPEPGRALDEQHFELSPDGASVITGWWHWDPAGQSHAELVTIDVATGKRRVLLSVPEYNFEGPRVSPDGRLIVCPREQHQTATEPTDVTLVVLENDGPGAPASPAATCCPAWTGGRWSRPGPTIPWRCTSWPTTPAGGRCSAWTWPPGKSPA